jgi:hypothetical protein
MLSKHKWLVTNVRKQKKLLKGFEMQVRVKENGEKFGSCGCGRSPTGDCIGWHGLTEEAFQHAQRNWLEEELRKDAESNLDD